MQWIREKEQGTLVNAVWEKTAWKISVSVTNLINNLTDIPDLLCRLYPSKFSCSQERLMSSLYHSTSIILEGVDLIENKDSYSRRVCAEEEKSSEEVQLVRMNNVKGITSIASSLLSLVGLMVGSPLEGCSLFTATILNLNLLWIIMKISICFYNSRFHKNVF